VTTILVDHDIEGQVLILWDALSTAGWLDLCPLELATFVQVGLPVDSNDRTVWRFAQAHGMILLTHNRNMNDADSLEQTIREENTPTSLPSLTVARYMILRFFISMCYRWYPMYLGCLFCLFVYVEFFRICLQ